VNYHLGAGAHRTREELARRGTQLPELVGDIRPSSWRTIFPVKRDLPSGTVTFLFTDVEDSTKLLHKLGAREYARALAEHRRVLREAFGVYGGVEVDTQGDAFFVAFPTAPEALQAATTALKGLAPGRIRVRMGIHTGTPHLTEDGYVGVDVHRAARIAGSGHGGQVLVSAATASLLRTSRLRDLGVHRLKDLSAPERIYQLGDEDFPPLRSLHQTNLPVPTTPFLGRERELAQVLGLLLRDDVRLLTLTGPAGLARRASRCKQPAQRLRLFAAVFGGCRSHRCVIRLSSSKSPRTLLIRRPILRSTSETNVCSFSSTISSM
jgi:class 3 adenylate cyclase